jgi:HAD superfamily hydrolase (TIGR01509 family)
VASAVLFDLYDTLVTAPWFEFMNEWALRMGLPFENVRRGFDATWTVRDRGGFSSLRAQTVATVEACGVPADPGLVTELAVFEEEFLESQVVLFSDAITALRSMQAEGVTTAIVSNCSLTTAALVDRLGLRDAVDRVVLSFEVGHVKPDEEIFRHTLDLLGLDTALFVDDQVAYLDGAARVGLSTVQMIHDEARNPKPSTGDHEVVSSFAEVKDRLDHDGDSAGLR